MRQNGQIRLLMREKEKHHGLILSLHPDSLLTVRALRIAELWDFVLVGGLRPGKLRQTDLI